MDAGHHGCGDGGGRTYSAKAHARVARGRAVREYGESIAFAAAMYFALQVVVAEVIVFFTVVRPWMHRQT